MKKKRHPMGNDKIEKQSPSTMYFSFDMRLNRKGMIVHELESIDLTEHRENKNRKKRSRKEKELE